MTMGRLNAMPCLNMVMNSLCSVIDFDDILETFLPLPKIPECAPFAKYAMASSYSSSAWSNTEIALVSSCWSCSRVQDSGLMLSIFCWCSAKHLRVCSRSSMSWRIS